MDKYEQRRLALQALVDELGHGGISRIAKSIGKEASYVSRMLYPPGKSGAKRIGEDSSDLLRKAYPAQYHGQHAEAPKFDNNVRVIPAGVRSYPVISFIQAGLLKELSDPYSPGDGFDVEYGDDDASPWAVFLEIEGDSMLPDFKPGDRVRIDPEVSPRPGDFVAARNTKQEATFKKYRVRGMSSNGNEVFELVPLNNDYPVLRSDEHHLTVIGTMTEHRRRFRRN